MLTKDNVIALPRSTATSVFLGIFDVVESKATITSLFVQNIVTHLAYDGVAESDSALFRQVRHLIRQGK